MVVPRLFPVVAYYRMSDERQERSIADQRAEVTAFAAKHGYQIIREYKDEAISGDETEKRHDFQRMMKDATELGDFEVVLCWDQDRFGRFDPLEAGYWIKPLRDAGIRLETVAQGRVDWEDFAGRIIYAVQQEGKHAFLRDLSRNVARGMLRSFREGKWLGGPAPYGYRYDKEALRLVPGDPGQVEIVRWLFTTYATTTVSIGELAQDLNGRGVPSPDSGLWHKSAVHKILTRPLYLGDLVWNRNHEGKYHGVAGGEITAVRRSAKRKTANAKEHWEVKQDTHEPLIDRVTYDVVQTRLLGNQGCNTPKKNGGDFIFTRLLYCAHCGSPMHGCRNVKREAAGVRTYKRYICGRYNSFGKGGGCQCNTITERQLVNAVIRRIQQDFLDPANLSKLRQELTRQVKGKSPGDATTAKRLRGRIAELEKNIDRGNEQLLLLPPDMIADASAKIREWRTERDRLQGEVQSMNTAGADTKSQQEKIERAVAQLWKLRDGLNDRTPRQFREVVRQMVARIDCRFILVPFGKKGRMRSELAVGRIHLRPDVAVSRDVPSGSPLTTVIPRRASSVASRSATRRP
jgi:site-specific DNA recombinase